MDMRTRAAFAAFAVAATVAGSLVATSAASPAVAANVVRITPNPASQSSAFEGWGTSLAWFAEATGGYPDAVRNDLYEKVFGTDGLNLNVARYNIGGGNATDVPPYLRPGGAVPGWWNPNLNATDANGAITSTYADRNRYKAAWDGESASSYDFTADPAQNWWVNALKNKVTKWEAFSNSPPYFLTQSGYVSGGTNSTSEQIAPADMAKFSSYLVNVTQHLEQTYGISFDSIEPLNEPNTNYWGTNIGSNGWPTTASRQEGAHVGPANQDLVIKALRDRLAQPGTTTKAHIASPDETNPSIFQSDWAGWSAEAKSAVSRLNVHTYGTSGRLAVRDIAKTSDKNLWMSEVEGNWDSSGKGFNQTNIDNGLGVAGRMVDDLRELEPSAWVLWQPVEDLYNMQKVEKTNWGSIFVDFDCNADGKSARRLADGDADPSCKVLTNAKFNTIRNFTHYIHPGDHLIPTDDTQTTAAVTAAGDGVTLVHVNSDTASRDVTIDLSQFGTLSAGATVTPIVTTQSPDSDVTANALVAGTTVPVDLAKKSATLTVPAKSVTTFVVKGVSGVAAAAPRLEDGKSYQLVGVQSGKALSGEASGAVLRTSATTASTAPAQKWTARVLSGAGSNRQTVALTNGAGKLLAATSQGTTLLDPGSVSDTDPRIRWIPSTTDGKTFALANASSQSVLDVNQASTADGASIGVYTANGGGNQRWTLASTAIASVSPVTAATPSGRAPSLPGQVTLSYAGGVQRSADVTWDTTSIDWSQTGTRQVSGQGTDAFGSAFTATATVDVGRYVDTDPVSVTVYAGSSLAAVQAAAPTTVPARVGSSDARTNTSVTWNWTGVAATAFAQAGVVTVRGSAVSNETGQPALDAQLSVVVTTPGETNVAPASTASATYTESNSYSVDRTKNGSTSDKGWSNWRSGTLNAQDTLTYALDRTRDVRHVKVFFYKDGSSTSWAKTMSVEYQKPGGTWTSAGTVTVDTPTSGAPVVDVPLGDVSASQVRVVMNAYPSTHLVVSEVQIFALAPSTSSVADLARLSTDYQQVPTFASGTTSYTVEHAGATWPTLRAAPTDTNARVAIVQPADANGVGTATVTAADGTTVRTYTVTVSRKVGLSAPALSGDPVTGSVLTASVATTDPADATTTLQWLRDGAPITSATGMQYTVASADVGHALSVRATAAKDGFTSATATSATVTARTALTASGVSVSTRCAAGKPVLTVQVTNRASVTVSVEIATPLGSRTITSLSAGKTGSVALTGRTGTLPAGSVVATVRGVVGGVSSATDTTATYSRRACG